MLSAGTHARTRSQGRGRRVRDVNVHFQAENMFEWKRFLQPPPGTFYSGYVWSLTVVFGEAYPTESPLLRFSTIPYHLNVPEDGMVCSDVVSTRYVHSMSMRDRLAAVQLMFREPQMFFAVQVEKIWNSKNCPDEYEAIALGSCENENELLDTCTCGANIAHDPNFTLGLTRRTLREDRSSIIRTCPRFGYPGKLRMTWMRM